VQQNTVFDAAVGVMVFEEKYDKLETKSRLLKLLIPYCTVVSVYFNCCNT